MDKLLADGTLHDFERHWIVNGFSCSVKSDALDSLKSVRGVKKIFAARRGASLPTLPSKKPYVFKPIEREKFDPGRYKHPWYIRYLLADKVWKKFGVTGEGTLNIVHDFTFVFSGNVTNSLYRNPHEAPGNEKDDDGNALVDDYHGFKPGDVIGSYNGENIGNQQELQAAKAKAASAELDSIPVVVQRDGRDIDLRFKPGPLGMILIVEYDDPTFQ